MQCPGGNLTISDWNAGLYDRFSEERQRPLYDLLAAVESEPLVAATDLGCGTGLSAEGILARWPTIELTGVDASSAMLEKARKRSAVTSWVQCDISAYQPPREQDLIVANASLHWLDHHATLLPRLISFLRPGGTLAVQMPNNLQEPSHRLMRETASRACYQEYLSGVSQRRALLSPGEYYDCLLPHSVGIRIWETRYLHALRDASAIFEWFESTGLRPFMDGLPFERRDAFRRDYIQQIARAYGEQADGRVLLTMPRLFITARRKA